MGKYCHPLDQNLTVFLRKLEPASGLEPLTTHTRMALPSLIRPPRRTKSEDAMKQIAEAQRLAREWDAAHPREP